MSKDLLDITKQLEDLGCRVVDNLKELDSPYYLQTGIFSLDLILSEEEGLGGGKCVEIFGQEGAGKTSLALQIMGNAQAIGMGAYYVNMERAITSSLVRCFPKLQADKINWIEPEHGQAAFNAIEMICKTQKRPFIVLDSVPACLSAAQYEENADKEFYAPIPRLLSTFMPKIKKFVGQSEAIVIFLNQLRDNVTGYGEKEKVPGGRAIKFYCDTRVRLRVEKKIVKGGKEDAENEVLGHRIKATTIKTRGISPYRNSCFPLYYGKGFDLGGDLLEMALQFGLVKKAGAWYEYNGHKSQGEMGMSAYINQNAEVQDKIREAIRKLLKS